MKAQTYLNICGVPTKVVTWGQGLPDVNTSDKVHDIILIIPGNPGFTPFYEEFVQEIYNRLKCSVWVISHAGHEVPNSFHQIVPALAGNEGLYDTDGQVLHKASFIAQYVPENARLHLIGHSIGAYMIIQLLKVPSIKSKVVGSYLLFPVFERILETPKGVLVKKAFTIPPAIPTFLAKIYMLLPNFIKTLLIEIFCAFTDIPKQYRSTCRDFIHPTIIERVIALASSEFVVVRERDDQTLRANKDKIKMYYGPTDGWAPEEYYLELKRDIPEIDAELCSHNYDHSFVLRHSKEIASLVADWIRMKQF